MADDCGCFQPGHHLFCQFRVPRTPPGGCEYAIVEDIIGERVMIVKGFAERVIDFGWYFEVLVKTAGINNFLRFLLYKVPYKGLLLIRQTNRPGGLQYASNLLPQPQR